MKKELIKRRLVKVIDAMAVSDGDGVKIARSIGSHMLPQLDPFLLLDELKSDDAADYIGGFPSHPHRGFETVTYMLAGQMRHKDSEGNEGVVRSGDIQWMTAGSGIIHSEMPEQKGGRLWGFQLWINLPAEQKMRAPRYQEIASSNVPELINEDSKVRVLAGEFEEVSGPVQGIATQPLLLDILLSEGAKQSISLMGNHTGIIYVYKGRLNVGGQTVLAQQLAYLSSGDMLEITGDEKETGVLVLAAAPLNEPVVRAGPFVMNTQHELEQAFSDFRSGNFLRRQ